MAIQVKNDINHPAARVDQSRQPTDLFVRWNVTRVCSVTGLDFDVTATTQQLAASIMQQAAIYQAGVPQLQSLCPGQAGAAGAIAVSNNVLSISQADNAVYIITTYQNPLPGQPLTFIVSDDTSLSAESTQLHPANKMPLLIPYKAPVTSTPIPPSTLTIPGRELTIAGVALVTQNDPNAKTEQYQATLKYSRPIRKVSIQGYVANTNLDPYRNAIGSVNKSPWLGYLAGYWRYDRFAANGILFGNVQKIIIELQSRINENWMSWETLNSPDLGRRVTVAPGDTQTLIQLGYFYGQAAANGIIAVGLYPSADFGALFGIPNAGSVPTAPQNAAGAAAQAAFGGALGGLGAF